MDKELLTLEEACAFTGLSKSSIYKLTASRVLGFYKPTGKRIWFSKEQLIEFLTRHRYKSQDELKKEVLGK
ncbi:helix-turn-helix domain-containing protein [Segetibacter koreensis]|uniref:helix-turn-helix domain-containing protein n=1 Tax=Segetibacter koreensis TaxID=398037 RepID=UPI0003728F6F|nr:helix-turn-helix domain-containing protein [Segetibacter koreensis]